MPQDMSHLFKDLPTIETERLTLRKILPQDDEDIFAYASDPDVASFVSWSVHKTIDDSRAYVRYVQDRYERGLPESWAIYLKARRRVVGTIGFVNYAPEHARAELGYALARRHWNQGLTTEAAVAVKAWAFGTMGLNRIDALCMVENVASTRVMERIGMKYEGLLRGYVYWKDHYHDLKIYSMLRSDYEGES